MKRFYCLLMSLLMMSSGVSLTARAAEAGETVDVTITLNTYARTMKLYDMDDNEMNTGSYDSSSYKYTFSIAPGNYRLDGYDSEESFFGSIVLTLDEDNSAPTLYVVRGRATNSDWTLGDDYTVTSRVVSREGTERDITVGKTYVSSYWWASFFVMSGDTYYASLLPNNDHATDGYLPLDKSATVTSSTTFTGALPMGYSYDLVVPAESTVFVGSKLSHYVPFVEQECLGVTDYDGDDESLAGYKVWSYKLGASGIYNYRVSRPGKLTQAKKFTMASANTEVVLTEESLAPYTPDYIEDGNESHNGRNVADIWTNADERGMVELSTGDTYQIVAQRNWQIIDTDINNYFLEPDYNYWVVDENGNACTDIVEVDANGVITAKAAGVAFVLVNYDALYADGQITGPIFGATWPENTAVMVITVDAAESTIERGMKIQEEYNSQYTHRNAGANIDAEHDVIYYVANEAEYGEYIFAPTGVNRVEVARPTIGQRVASYTGFSSDLAVDNGDGTWTLKVGKGRNIVRLSGDGGVTYQVVRGKEMTYNVTNVTNPDQPVKPGDQVSVLLTGVQHPANKLSGIYNFWAYTHYYDMDDSDLAAKSGGQYTYASSANARTFELTIPEEWDTTKDYQLHDGYIYVTYFGDPIGNHRLIDFSVGRNPNFTASQVYARFAQLPALTLYAGVQEEVEKATYELRVLTFEDEDFRGSIANVPFTVDGMTAANYWSSLIDSEEYGGPLLYNDFQNTDYAWYDDGNTGLYGTLNGAYGHVYWSGGSAVSNYVLEDYAEGGFMTQLSAYVPDGGNGGHNGSENFLVFYGYNDIEQTAVSYDARPYIWFKDGIARVIDHAWINLNAYALNSAYYGDSFSTAAEDGDYVDIWAEGLYADGESTGKIVIHRVIEGYDIQEEWERWDLSELGEVAGVRFNVVSPTLSGDYGLNFPAYFMLDDIAVRYDLEADDDGGTSGIDFNKVDTTATSASVEIYTISGIRMNPKNLTPGVYIRKQGETVQKVYIR